MTELIRNFDHDTFAWINGLAGKALWLDRAMVSLVNDYAVPTILSLVLVFLWLGIEGAAQREVYQRAVLATILAVGLANILVTLMNLVYFRPRPFATMEVTLLFYHPTDSSFPSNPATSAFALATPIWLKSRKIGWALLGVAALYGFSRIYVGVCYPLDMLAGILLGMGSGWLITWLLPRLEPLPSLALRLGRRLYLS